ncbi:MAG TPA: LysR substrate-binding domain-containing protein [Myxococcota bacterium]|nr:LysR substrate-binding domain-containing protein [Myxococcota bacterium]
MKNATMRQLRVFESAARHLSVTRAAEELHLTPPAVSIQIRLLEGHAGAELFERLGRRLSLTQAGEAALARAREILALVRDAEEAIAGLGSLEQGFLDVAVINAGDYFFPWLIAAFRDAHPHIRLRLAVGNREELLARLASHDVDLAVMSHPPAQEAFAAAAFAPHPHVIVAAPGHALAGKRSVGLETVAREPLITREPGSATHLAMQQAFAESGIVPRIEMEIGSNETIKQAVAAGFGVGFLSAHAVRQELALGRLAVVRVRGFPVMRQWYVVHRRDRRLPRIAEAFQRFLVSDGERLIRRHEKAVG